MHRRIIPRSIRTIFGGKSKEGAHKRFPDEYYRSFYINKKLYNGVELVAKIEGKSKKKAVEFLLDTGFSRYMGNKLKEFVEQENQIREQDLKRHPYPTKFVRAVRKYCGERGVDTGKFF